MVAKRRRLPMQRVLVETSGETNLLSGEKLMCENLRDQFALCALRDQFALCAFGDRACEEDGAWHNSCGHRWGRLWWVEGRPSFLVRVSELAP